MALYFFKFNLLNLQYYYVVDCFPSTHILQWIVNTVGGGAGIKYLNFSI